MNSSNNPGNTRRRTAHHTDAPRSDRHLSQQKTVTYDSNAAFSPSSSLSFSKQGTSIVLLGFNFLLMTVQPSPPQRWDHHEHLVWLPLKPLCSCGAYNAGTWSQPQQLQQLQQLQATSTAPPVSPLCARGVARPPTPTTPNDPHANLNNSQRQRWRPTQ